MNKASGKLSKNNHRPLILKIIHDDNDTIGPISFDTICSHGTIRINIENLKETLLGIIITL